MPENPRPRAARATQRSFCCILYSVERHNKGLESNRGRLYKTKTAIPVNAVYVERSARISLCETPLLPPVECDCFSRRTFLASSLARPNHSKLIHLLEALDSTRWACTIPVWLCSTDARRRAAPS